MRVCMGFIHQLINPYTRVGNRILYACFDKTQFSFTQGYPDVPNDNPKLRAKLEKILNLEELKSNGSVASDISDIKKDYQYTRTHACTRTCTYKHTYTKITMNACICYLCCICVHIHV